MTLDAPRKPSPRPISSRNRKRRQVTAENRSCCCNSHRYSTIARLPFHAILLCALQLVACGGTSSEPATSSDGHGPPLNRETDRFAFNLVRISAECLAANGPLKTGSFAVVAELGEDGAPPRILDGGSTPGNERSLVCVVREAPIQLRSPNSPPGPYVRVTFPLPGGPQDVRIDFPKRRGSQ